MRKAPGLINSPRNGRQRKLPFISQGKEGHLDHRVGWCAGKANRSQHRAKRKREWDWRRYNALRCRVHHESMKRGHTKEKTHTLVRV